MRVIGHLDPGEGRCQGRTSDHGRLHRCQRYAGVHVRDQDGRAAQLCGRCLKAALGRRSLAGVLWPGAPQA